MIDSESRYNLMTTSTDAQSLPKKAWATPTLERLSLKDALSGAGVKADTTTSAGSIS